MVPYAGGLLIRDGDRIIGGLGVSGAAASPTDHVIGATALGRQRPRRPAENR